MIIQSKRIWIGNQFIAVQIETKESKILAIHPYGKYKVDYDYGKKRIVPGFIDVHTHGAYGAEATFTNEEKICEWIKRIPEEGITGILPTTETASDEATINALKRLSNISKENISGAEILGIHLEGPFVCDEYKGAHDPKYITDPTLEKMLIFQNAANGLIKYVTIASELDKDFEVIRYCANNNIVASLGHSAATYEEAMMAIANGAKSATHTYNGMRPFNHRNPGLIGALLASDDVYSEIICDGNHTALSTLTNFFKTKDKNHCIMVTDSLFAKALKPGVYSHHGESYQVIENGSVFMAGTTLLAGSTLKMNEGLKVLVENACIPFDTALKACTINPAACLRVDDRKGRIAVGYDADMVVLDDDYSVIQTFARGDLML